MSPTVAAVATGMLATGLAVVVKVGLAWPTVKEAGREVTAL